MPSFRAGKMRICTLGLLVLVGLLGCVLLIPFVAWSDELETPIQQIFGDCFDVHPNELPDMLKQWDQKVQKALDNVFEALDLNGLINTALPPADLEKLVDASTSDIESGTGGIEMILDALRTSLMKKIDGDLVDLEKVIQESLMNLGLPLPLDLFYSPEASELTRILFDEIHTWITKNADETIGDIKGFGQYIKEQMIAAIGEDSRSELARRLKAALKAVKDLINEGKIVGDKANAHLNAIHKTIKDTLTHKITEPLGELLKEALEFLQFKLPTGVESDAESDKAKQLKVPGFDNLGIKILKWFFGFVSEPNKCRFEFGLVGYIFLPSELLKPVDAPTADPLKLPFGAKVSLDLKGNFSFDQFFIDPKELLNLTIGGKTLSKELTDLSALREKLSTAKSALSKDVQNEVGKQIDQLDATKMRIDELKTQFEVLSSQIPDEVSIAGTGFKLKLKDALKDFQVFLPTSSDFWPPADSTCPDDPRTLPQVRACLEQKVFRTPGSFPGKDWKGFFIKQLTIILPDEFQCPSAPDNKVTASVKNFAISQLGFSGRIEIKPVNCSDLTIGGLKARITSFALDFLNNVPSGSAITAKICIPKAECSFEVDANKDNDPIDVEFHFNLDGSWSAKLSATNPKKICFTTCTDNAKNYVQLLLQQIEFGYDPVKQGAFFASDGKLSVQVQDVKKIFDLSCDDPKNQANCHGIDFTGLKMQYSQGSTAPDHFSFELKGGWVDVTKFAEQEATKVKTKFAIRRVGFGTLEGEEDFLSHGWLGLGGDFNLGEAFGVGGKLNDLKLKWGANDGTFKIADKFYLDISSIGIEIDKPYLQLKGSVTVSEGGFAGTADGVIPPLRVGFGATIKLGKTDKNDGPSDKCKDTGGAKYQYWYFGIKAELPTGTPLATDISLYGLSGGAGNNVFFDEVKLDDQGRVKADNIPLTCKGNFAIKFGVTLGTTHDNGYSVTSDDELIIQTSGPVITFAGKGWINRNRFERFKVPPNLDLKIVYDNSQPLFFMYLAGYYKIQGNADDSGGSDLTLVKLSGSFEMLFSPPEWHIYFGQKPKPKRIKAQILEIMPGTDNYFVTADTYLMIGNMVPFPQPGGAPDTRLPGVLLGASLQLGDEIDADVAVIYYQIWASGDLAASWRPRQIWVSLGIGGRAGFKIFGIGFGVKLSSEAEGQYPNPSLLTAMFSIGVDLPWPLDDFEFSFERTWGDEDFAKKHPDPPFEQPIRSANLISPVGNRPAQENGTALCNPFTTLGQKGEKLDTCPVEDEITQAPLLNPRVSLNFHRPMDSPATPDSVHGDNRNLKGVIGTIWDQVGKYQAQYRLTGVLLFPLDENDIMTDKSGQCSPKPSPETRAVVPSSVFWGSINDIRAGSDLTNEEKSKEAEVLVSQPGVGQKNFGADVRGLLARERIRQILTLQPAPLPPADAKPIVNEVPIPGPPLGALDNHVDYPAPSPPGSLKPNQLYLLKADVSWQAYRLDPKDPTKREAVYTDTDKDGKTKESPEASTLSFCFRTGNAPKGPPNTANDGLNPYVAWTNPFNNTLNAFWSEDMMVLFNTAGMQTAFGESPLQMALYDQNGQLVPSSTTTNLKGQQLRLPASILAGEPPFEFAVNLLQPHSRYFVKLLKPGADPKKATPDQILYEFQFSTSEFPSFDKLMADKATGFGGPGISEVTLSGSDKDHQLKDDAISPNQLPVQVVDPKKYIVLKTKEALPWGQEGRLQVSLSDGASSISLKRLTPDNETTQVFVPVNPGSTWLESGKSYTLTLEYHGGLIRDQIPSLDWARADEILEDPDFTNLKKELERFSDGLIKTITITFKKG